MQIRDCIADLHIRPANPGFAISRQYFTQEARRLEIPRS